MLRNYLKICLRNLYKDKLFSAINLLGLTLGITAFLIIFQYVSFERSYDNFHENPENVYRIASKRYANNELITDGAAAVPPLRAVMEAGLPEIEAAVRIYFDGNSIVEFDHPDGNRVFNEERAYYADETFFDVFGFPLTQGNPQEALDAPRKIVISTSTASKYFGGKNPIGETLQVTSQASTEYLVAGVFQDPPINSHFRPDILFSFKTYTEVVRPDWGVDQNWIWNDFYTYVRAKNSSTKQLTERITKLAHDTWGDQYVERNVDFEFYAQPIQDIHTKSLIEKEFEVNTKESVLNWLTYIAIIILVIAWVNYFNLSLAKCVDRAREVGVRKTFGASQLDVKIQFWTEAVIMNIAAIACGLTIFVLAQKLSQDFLHIYYPIALTPKLFYILSLLILGGLLFSAYPGVFLSSLKLLELVQGKLKTKPKGKYLIKGLILFQMIATPLLIAGAYLIQQQTKHLINQDLGVNTEQVLIIEGPRVISGNRKTIYDRFKNEVEQINSVEHLSAMSLLPGRRVDWYSSFKLNGDSTELQSMNVNLADYNFEEVLDIELIAGRTFDRQHNDSLNLIINESAARLWGYEPNEIIGRTFWWRYSPDIHHFEKQVIGVVKDYQQLANSTQQAPMIYSLNRYTPADFAGKEFIIKMNGTAQRVKSSINEIEDIWQAVYPNDPFNYQFMDDSFAIVFEKESQMLGLVQVFGLLSFILAGLGLFGLSALVTTQRTKEVGIRKVLGAKISNILTLLSRDFVMISMVAYLIAVPLIMILAKAWLSNYEIRISLNMVFYLIPFISTLLVVLISTISNSLSVAHKNPVESLRHE